MPRPRRHPVALPTRRSTLLAAQGTVLQVVAAIERQLDAPWTLADGAAIAGCSPWHLHRRFRALVGEPFVGFVRRLRLQRAALQLPQGRLPLRAIALAAGYADLPAFGRAFRTRFGTSPSVWRRKRRSLLRQLHAERGQRLPAVALRELPSQRLAFVRRDYGHIREAWQQLGTWAVAHGLEGPAIAIAHDDPGVTAPERCRYDAAVVVPRGIRPGSGIALTSLAGGWYAVAPHRGPPTTLFDTFLAVYVQGLPALGVRPAEGVSHVVYPSLAAVRPGSGAVLEVRIPVERGA